MLKKILQNLKTGNYRIEYREHCDCEFYWHLENGELDCVTTDGDCWYDNALVMDDLAGQCDDELSVGSDGVIAIYDAYFGLAVSWLAASCDAEQEIINAIKDSDAYQKLTDGINSPDANNDLHDQRKREALAKWLSKNDHLRTYVYYPGDFANKYVCVLLALPHYFYEKDYLQIPAHWLPKTAEEWAERYLRKDTVDTQFDIGFELINQIYKIDYCWYDRHIDLTMSHDAERYFFVDLKDAETFLNILEPVGIDCYDLDKLTIDSDDGEIDDIDCQKTKWGPDAAKEARRNGNPFAPGPEPETVFEHYGKRYGVYNWQGIELAFIQVPFPSRDVYGKPCYFASAIDRKGNYWSVRWDILPGTDINDTDTGDHCDWENPTYAKMV